MAQKVTVAARVDPGTRDRWKAAVALQGRSGQTVLTEFIEAFVENSLPSPLVQVAHDHRQEPVSGRAQ